MKFQEARKRYVDRSDEGSWTWPEVNLSYEDVHKPMSILLEIPVNHLFRSFVYSYGETFYLQSSGGSIGARLTMCVVRLVLQDLYGDFSWILDRSQIIQYLRGLYVDDGRKIVNRLELGTRLVKDEMMS